MQSWLICLACVTCLTFGCNAAPTANLSAGGGNEPPAAPREFRAAWVATVANIDWPTKPGLSTAEQQAEAIRILDTARELNLNAIVLQVRTACDALYDSRYEPWSYYLTGEQGQPPRPYYDPLKFWVDEAHKRGLELHAWFNPYRARHGGAKYETSRDHVSRTQPQIVREFNNWQWLDPAEPAAQDQTYNVFLDVVRRYDVDGIHIDDYFYPYPDYLKNADFPDEDAWQRYQKAGGTLSRGDWRRQSVDQLIQRIYEGIKNAKRHVQFGISPFGIAQPGKPPEVKSSFNQYEALYADAELWLREGWLDYWTPQLYWKIDSPQPYAALLRWWVEQNVHNRHIWPGNYTSRVGERPPAEFKPTTTQAALPPEELEKERQKFEADRRARTWDAQEIVDQIEVTREIEGATGNVHFSMKAFLNNWQGLNDALRAGPYAEPALVPATPWLDDRPPNAPEVRITRDRRSGRQRVTWRAGRGERPWQYAVWARHGDTWRFSVHPAASTGMDLVADETGATPVSVVVSAVDRSGNESRRVTQAVPRR
jgi:uncharacterized lipoprotein YddW (UPF0748 family)